MPPTLPKGLLLVGGRSKRMGFDKATLEYEGKNQFQRAYELLKPFCQTTYLSVRKGQTLPETGLKAPILEDDYDEIGPLGGMLTAMSADPWSPWLIVACDLPFLTKTSLENLWQKRDADAIATAYKSSYDGLPEPLCAIYEPRALGKIKSLLEEENQRCPRKILMQTKPKLLEPLEPHALDNVNTLEEYKQAAAELSKASNS